VDIWLYSPHATGPVAVAQCKHWRGKLVGVKQMREFYGVMTANQMVRGTFVTSSTFTHDAQQFAQANGINALDINRLLALIYTRTADQQKILLATAYEGEYWRPTCASCGIKMMSRSPTKGGAKFWGCRNYPRCRAYLPMTSANA
jgi:restriction system protein